MQLVEQLMCFGLTRHESTIYLKLQTDGELTGYEVGKLTGISNSNTYLALSGLVEKGAAYVMEGNVTKYVAVPYKEFSDNYIHRLQEIQKDTDENMPKRKAVFDGYFTIKGENHVMDKVRTLLNDSEIRVYMVVSVDILELFRTELERLIERGIKVVLLTEGEFELKNAYIYQHPTSKQLRLIVDSCKVLSGEFIGKEESTCLYSQNTNFVNVFKKMLQSEIRLIELIEKNVISDVTGYMDKEI